MVAVKVASLLSHLISVTTFFCSTTVFTVSLGGVLKLSGERALATALASFSSAYSSVIVASNLFAPQLFSNQVVNGFDKRIYLVQRHLGSRRDVVSAAFAPMRL